jgi:L-ascorbate metabolism protein UlaG (beta-lactamase superfamily)
MLVIGRIGAGHATVVAAAITFGVAGVSRADDIPTSRAHYLGNAGVMVEHGATKILFDPLFDEDFNEYELVPPDMQRALLAGAAPWDGVDAVFVSHYHDDHYDPALMLSYLKANPGIVLYAPAQAVDSLHESASLADAGVFQRVRSLALAYGDAAMRIEMEGLLIEALFVPHSGWPGSNTEVENISWRVTLEGVATVTHLGDADGDVVHFEQSAGHWQQRPTHLALPPYWFYYGSDKGGVLLQGLNADRVIGVHVPKNVPDEPSARAPELQGVDLFTRPGESRDIP